MNRRERPWATLAPQLPRDKADTLLLLFSSVLVLAPHAAHLPHWITAAVAASLLWRTAITWRGVRLPRPALLLPLALLAMAGVYASFKTLLGREAGVAMLTLLLTFKLLEMHARRDLFVVIFLSFFLLLTSFFYSQSMAAALAMAGTVVVLLTALLSFQYAASVPPLARRLRQAAAMAALAAPLALLLFVAFPRIQGPLWGLPGDARGARSGLSDSMSPGNISDLALSDESAFQVRFAGPAPARQHLYWRAVVLGKYDGRTWNRVQPRPGAPATGLRLAGPLLRYRLTLEPGNTRWLPALEMPARLPDLPDGAYELSAELELVATRPLAQRLRYALSAQLDYRLQADAPAAEMRQWLELPAGFNPRTLAWAGSLRSSAPEAAIAAVLKGFGEGRFSYTLQPPLLGKHAVDEFLFTTKAGFCEHYAGAFVVLMRAMGIPARVVTGYQGGETNALDATLTVRQSDAHAWAEVWLAGRGWLRIDPTAAVAPERIASNLAGALPPPDPLGLQRLQNLIGWREGPAAWVATLRFGMNALSNGWNQWVLDFNPQRQRGLLQELRMALGDWRRVLDGAALALLAPLAYGAARRLRARRRSDPLDALYLAFCRRQAQLGCPRAPDEGPQRYAERLAALPATPQQSAARLRFLAIYAAIKYGVASPAEKALAITTLRSLLTKSR